MVKIILTLSHGQSEVERGFSQNHICLENNIIEDSIVSRRIVKYHMLSNDLKPHTIDVTTQMRKSYRAAHQRYLIYLDDVKNSIQFILSFLTK